MPPKSDPFPKVREARELLRQRAQEIIELYLQNAQDARDANDFETAEKSLRYLIEHMPRGDDGETLVDISVDKPKESDGPKGPIVQIGFALGGVERSLPPANVIDAEKVK